MWADFATVKINRVTEKPETQTNQSCKAVRRETIEFIWNNEHIYLNTLHTNTTHAHIHSKCFNILYYTLRC